MDLNTYCAVRLLVDLGCKHLGLRFDNNSVVILNAQHQPIGTRVFGPVTRELRTEKFMKIVSLALEVL